MIPSLQRWFKTPRIQRIIPGLRCVTSGLRLPQSMRRNSRSDCALRELCLKPVVVDFTGPNPPRSEVTETPPGIPNQGTE